MTVFVFQILYLDGTLCVVNYDYNFNFLNVLDIEVVVNQMNLTVMHTSWADTKTNCKSFGSIDFLVSETAGQ